MDPDGRFSFDPDNGCINADLNDYKDMPLASTQFVLNEGRGYNKVIATDNETGNTITFNNAESMVDFVSNMTEKMDFESMFSVLADSSSVISIASEVIDNPSVKKVLGPVGNILNLPQTIDSVIAVTDNPNFDTISDITINIIGYAGVPGAAIGFTLSKAKPALINGAIGLGKINNALEKYFLNLIGQFHCGMDFVR